MNRTPRLAKERGSGPVTASVCKAHVISQGYAHRYARLLKLRNEQVDVLPSQEKVVSRS